MSEVKETPKDWEVVNLGKYCKLKNGFAFKSTAYLKEGIPIIRISDINDGIVSSEDSVRVLADDEYENYLVENNDILVAMSGATTGKFGIYKSTEKAYQNQRVGKFKILDEKVLGNQFLFYQINALKRQIEKDAYGGAQPNISSTKIEQMQIVVPPLTEQQAIVSKIEELLSELDKGIENLCQAQQQLKIYRQSVLKWAFEGKLTNKNVKGGELPKGWKMVKVKDVCVKIIGGGTPSTSIAEYWKGNIPWISSADIYGIRDVQPRKKISERAIKESATNLLPSGGIIVVTRVGLGKLAIAPFDLCFSQDSQGLILNEKLILKEYALLVLHKEVQIFKHQSRGTTIKGVTKKQLAELEIALPSIKEQQTIIQVVESRLSLTDKLEESISQSLVQAEALRQSILKKAFEGRLV